MAYEVFRKSDGKRVPCDKEQFQTLVDSGVYVAKRTECDAVEEEAVAEEDTTPQESSPPAKPPKAPKAKTEPNPFTEQ